jgi:hypothetical protein
MPSVQSRAWCYTINNYTQVDESRLLSRDVKGHACGREVGESGTPHLQGVVYCHEKSTLSHMKTVIGQTAHLEVMRGTWEQARTYALKDGDILVDSGEGPKP